MTAPIRTYGTYRFIDPRFSNAEHRNGAWMLDIEPAVRARAKKVLARVRQSRSTYITVAHTLEVARDLVWFMDRFPLRPTDTRSAEVLDEAYHRHIELEQQVGQIIAGTAPLPTAPPTIAKKPREYQLQALQLVKTRGRILLGDDVGLGKTFTSLLTTTLDGALPAVVVPPTHLPPRWMTELEDAFPTLTVELAAKTTPGAHIFEGRLADVTIVPYSKLAGWSGALAPHIRTVIFDEAQELRHGIGTEKGAAAAGLAEDATYVIGATATPVYNYGSEIWNIADILSPGELGTRDEFLREWGGYTMSNGRSTVRDPHAPGVYHRDCQTIAEAHRTCTCTIAKDGPWTNGTRVGHNRDILLPWGRCATCNGFRSHKAATDARFAKAQRRAVAILRRIPTGTRDATALAAVARLWRQYRAEEKIRAATASKEDQ